MHNLMCTWKPQDLHQTSISMQTIDGQLDEMVLEIPMRSTGRQYWYLMPDEGIWFPAYLADPHLFHADWVRFHGHGSWILLQWKKHSIIQRTCYLKVSFDNTQCCTQLHDNFTLSINFTNNHAPAYSYSWRKFIKLGQITEWLTNKNDHEWI